MQNLLSANRNENERITVNDSASRDRGLNEWNFLEIIVDRWRFLLEIYIHQYFRKSTYHILSKSCRCGLLEPCLGVVNLVVPSASTRSSPKCKMVWLWVDFIRQANGSRKTEFIMWTLRECSFTGRDQINRSRVQVLFAEFIHFYSESKLAT